MCFLPASSASPAALPWIGWGCVRAGTGEGGQLAGRSPIPGRAGDANSAGGVWTAGSLSAGDDLGARGEVS